MFPCNTDLRAETKTHNSANYDSDIACHISSQSCLFFYILEATPSNNFGLNTTFPSCVCQPFVLCRTVLCASPSINDRSVCRCERLWPWGVCVCARVCLCKKFPVTCSDSIISKCRYRVPSHVAYHSKAVFWHKNGLGAFKCKVNAIVVLNRCSFAASIAPAKPSKLMPVRKDVISQRSCVVVG